MANKKLVDYIIRQIKKGQTKAMTKRTLIQHGWPISSINEGLVEAKKRLYGSYMKPVQERPQRTSYKEEYLRRLHKKPKPKKKGFFASLFGKKKKKR